MTVEKAVSEGGHTHTHAPHGQVAEMSDMLGKVVEELFNEIDLDCSGSVDRSVRATMTRGTLPIRRNVLQLWFSIPNVIPF